MRESNLDPAGLIESIVHFVTGIANVPGIAASAAAEQELYNRFPLGMVVVDRTSGAMFRRTNLTEFAAGGRITRVPLPTDVIAINTATDLYIATLLFTGDAGANTIVVSGTLRNGAGTARQGFVDIAMHGIAVTTVQMSALTTGTLAGGHAATVATGAGEGGEWRIQATAQGVFNVTFTYSGNATVLPSLRYLGMDVSPAAAIIL